MRDHWWRRRKKKDPWFNDLYDELERLGDLIDKTMQKAFEKSSKNIPTKRNRFKDFFIKISPDGRPSIREFNSYQPLHPESKVSDDSEPLVDIIEEGETVVVLAALPGVNKNEIDLRLTENCLTFSVDAADFEWYKELNLPTRVDPKSARASYKNGVLEIGVKKLEKIFRSGRISLEK